MGINNMLKKIFLCALIVLTTLPIANIVNADTGSQLQQLEAYIQEQFTEAQFPGGAYAVFNQEEIILSQGIGYSNLATKQEAAPHTVYSIASITKVLTAAAILKLADEQLVELDAPVTTYLPWFQYKDGEQSAKVTVRHLLTHSAGVNRLSADGAIYQDIRNNRNSLENAAKALSSVKMNHEPGAVGQYCNTCYNVLGLIFEAVTEQNYETFMEEQWFKPLGMNNTTFAPYNITNTEVAKEYGYLFGLQREVKPYWKEFGNSQAPEGGAYSSVTDLAHWAIALFQSRSPQYFQSGVVASDLSHVVYTESGFERIIVHDKAVLRKSGDGMGSSSYLAYIPSLQSGFVLLVGEADGETTKTIGEGIIQLLLGETPQSAKGGLNVMQLLGFISLTIVIISLLLVVWLCVRVIRLRQKQFSVKRRWTVGLRLLLLGFISIPLWLLLLKVRPTEAGFYGYPYDLAISLISLAITTSLWAFYSAVILFRERTH